MLLNYLNNNQKILQKKSNSDFDIRIMILNSHVGLILLRSS